MVSTTALLCIPVAAALWIDPHPHGMPGPDLHSAAASADSVHWEDARDLTIEGKGWRATSHPYDRLPARAHSKVREPVWELSKHSAGLSVRFVSDSPRIVAEWTLRIPLLNMDHMASTGEAGVDLYVRSPDGWRWVGMGRVDGFPTNRAELVLDAPAGVYEYRLYLPLYNGIETLRIGVDPGFQLGPSIHQREQRRPICFYGTSVTQGGVASRPGMAYPAIVGRALDVPVVNLGFSGNGRMDPELAELLGDIDCAAYVLDCGANMSPEMVEARTVPFIRQLRRLRPTTPIVLVEAAGHQGTWFSETRRSGLRAHHAATRQAYEALMAEGVADLFYVAADSLLGDDGEATTDGIHLSDLGFTRMAQSLERTLQAVLSGDRESAAGR